MRRPVATNKLKMQSKDLTEVNVERLAELFPNAVTEAIESDGHGHVVRRVIDFDVLRRELSGNAVEGQRERYQLDWPGKRSAALAANTPTAKTLRPMREESVDFDATRNLFIEGDNLEALKLLRESYLGKVKMIYIDPPYNTGKDFIYNDDFSEAAGDYLQRSMQSDDTGARLVSNPESNGRFHSDWLSMMYPRLKLARDLLAEDGAIFISIDDNEHANLVRVCEEVFGEANYIASFVWKSKSGGANDSGAVAVDHEYVVCFGRNTAASPLRLDPDGEATTTYSQQDEHGRYSLERLDKQNLQYSSSLDYELIGPDGTVYTLKHRDPGRPNAVWRWSQQRVQRDIDQLVFKDGNVYTKNYEKSGTKPRSLLIDQRFGRTRTGSTELRELLGGSYFDNPKPTKLIESLVNIATDEDSIVLDFFAGSGTTPHAVLNVNARRGGARRWIAIQLPEAAGEGSAASHAGFNSIPGLARERIRRAGAAVSGSGIDTGFRAFRVDSSNMADVWYSADETTQSQLSVLESSVKPDRSSEDLLFQVLLDLGLDVAAPISLNEVEGHEIFALEDDALVACFDHIVDVEIARSIARRAPLRAVFLDSGLVRDDARINLEQVFQEVSPSTEVQAI